MLSLILSRSLLSRYFCLSVLPSLFQVDWSYCSLLYFVCVCGHTCMLCMSTGTCVHVAIHAHVCMWRPEVDLGCSLYCPHVIHRPMVSHRNWSSPVVDSLASQFTEIPCPCSLCLLSPEIICGPTYSPSFYMGARGTQGLVWQVLNPLSHVSSPSSSVPLLSQCSCWVGLPVRCSALA